jgi:hypothetical protein
MSPRLPVCLLSVVLLASCVTLDPNDRKVFVQAAQTTDVDPASVVLASRVLWSTGDVDFCLTVYYYCTGEQRYISMREEVAHHTGVLDPPKHSGLLVLTASQLTFVEVQDSGAYRKSDSIAIDNITALEMRSFGLARHMRLAAEKSARRFYFVSLTGPLGVQHDAAKNDELFDYLKNRVRAGTTVRTF